MHVVIIIVVLFVRLIKFINTHNISMCRELSGGFSGTCLSEPDVAELWRLHYEVNPLLTEYSTYSFACRKSTLVICREYSQPRATLTNTTIIFPVEYQR